MTDKQIHSEIKILANDIKISQLGKDFTNFELYEFAIKIKKLQIESEKNEAINNLSITIKSGLEF